MKHVAAYMLCTIGGNASPSAADVQAVLSSVGIEADAGRLDTLIAELNGKNLNEIIAAGSAKLASVPSGGGAAASSAAPAAAAGGDAPAAEKAVEKVEEKEESDDDMGFGLFD